MFIKNNIYEEIKTFGYDVIPSFLNFQEVEELYKVYYENLSSFEHENITISILTQNIDLRKRIHNLILGIVKPKIDVIFSNYKVAIAHFISKRKGCTNIPIHQDPMITDQVNEKSYGLWFALENIGFEEGGIGVLPKSHVIFPPFQSEFFDPVYQSNSETLISKVKYLKLNKGDLLIMDNRLVHLSSSNKLLENRIVPIVKLTSEDSQFYVLVKNEILGLYKMDDDFYLNANWLNNPEKINNNCFLGEFKYDFSQWSEEKIRTALNKIIPPKYPSALSLIS